MTYPSVEHHGALHGVTGSCHQLHLDEGLSLLVDCGLFQGGEQESRRDRPVIDFAVEGIQALIVTHVHIDHVGRIPDLLAAGFTGPIVCSEPSAVLLPLVLEDAFKLTVSRQPSLIDRYLQVVRERIVALPYDHWHALIDKPSVNCNIRLQRAGHILGSAYVECDINYALTGVGKRIVFSGDLGAPHAPLLQAPQSPERADILILESTYGDRLHGDRSDRQQRLEAVIDQAMADHGTILIPAFSLGRTQELLYEIEDILHRKAFRKADAETSSAPVERAQRAGDPGEDADCDHATADSTPLPVDWPEIPVILDSPLASRLTKAYRELSEYWNEDARTRLREGRNPLKFRQLITIDDHHDHIKTVNYLASTGRPAIVIAGSGMCAQGRIVNYLKAMLGDKRHHVVFVGYQAKGTPGAVIQACEGASGFVAVDLDGEMYDVRAAVSTLGGYSAHADQKGLVGFVKGIAVQPETLRLVHGSASAKEALGSALAKQR